METIALSEFCPRKIEIGEEFWVYSTILGERTSQ